MSLPISSLSRTHIDIQTDPVPVPFKGGYARKICVKISKFIKYLVEKVQGFFFYFFLRNREMVHSQIPISPLEKNEDERNKKSVQFQDTLRIRISPRGDPSQCRDVDGEVNFCDRFACTQEGYWLREDRTKSVNGTLGKSGIIELSNLQCTTFEDLAANSNRPISFMQLEKAFFDKLCFISCERRDEIFAFISEEFSLVMQELQFKNTNFNEIKTSLSFAIRNNNLNKLELSLDCFTEMHTTVHLKRKICNTPEYKESRQAFFEGTWLEDEEKEFTFKYIEDTDFQKVDLWIEDLFRDQEVQLVLSRFLSASQNKLTKMS